MPSNFLLYFTDFAADKIHDVYSTCFTTHCKQMKTSFDLPKVFFLILLFLEMHAYVNTFNGVHFFFELFLQTLNWIEMMEYRKATDS